MKEASIPIARLRERLIYDPETGLLKWRFNVSPTGRVGQVAGCLSQHGYIKIRIDRTTLLAHRVIWAIHTGRYAAGLIDHVNGVRSDNRWANLREANLSQNQWNRKKHSSTSGFKGVAKLPYGSFQAVASLNGKSHYLGVSNTAEGAALIYDRFAMENFGEFASLNFPEAIHENR